MLCRWWALGLLLSKLRLVCLETVFGLLENGVWFASMGLVSMAFGLLGYLGLGGVWIV
jgi:hypothetical protein